jgi:L-iditol 2-dehydrogenase
MKVARMTGIRGMRIDEAPEPRVVADDDVLIEMKRVGVCGSDIHYYTEGAIGSQVVAFPWTAGHEGAGVVREVGRAVTRVKPGDRIAIDPTISCGVCDQCVGGRRHTCRNQKFLGCPGQVAGCLAELIVLPESCCFPIPDGLKLDQAALVEPLSIAVYGVSLAGSLQGLDVAILGAGPIGQCVLAAAKAEGAERIYVTDKIDTRLAVAKHAGATWTGNPDREDVVAAIGQRCPLQLDVVFECSGDTAAIDQAVELLKPGGKLLLIGIPGGHNRVSFDINLLRRKEICIQNVRRQNECVDKAIGLIADGKVDMDYLLTHHFPLDGTRDAYELVADYRDGVLKAMIGIG